MSAPKNAFHLILNRRPVEATHSPLTGLQILELGKYGADYELYELHGEGDPSGGVHIGHDQLVELRSGMHFRAIPGNANFGLVASGNPELDEDVSRLVAAGQEVELLTDGMLVGVVVKELVLPPGYNMSHSDLLMETTTQYPAAAMDMFWVDQQLFLESGAMPAGGESIEIHFGRTWRRYSWHRNSAWVPGRDDLVGHFEFCVARLQRVQ
jgi:Prokaryotic E2 family E